ncbi:unnamed protein product [Effrenium voratum]|uniref:Uncharacterized protein n=1 Tax=Effrenium voratum TaxID=2562239 RepID=A0AA36I0Z8_9DINO|nr:unnamed protein product [Effrenium voratum]
MPDPALALPIALAKITPMAPLAADALHQAIDEQFNIYSDQRDSLFQNAKDTIIAARSALAQAEPEVTEQGVGFLGVFGAFMDFTNQYFNCFKDKKLQRQE